MGLMGLGNELDQQLRPPAHQFDFFASRGARNLWSKCDECGTMLFHRELSDNLNVCTHRGHHMAISPIDLLGCLTVVFSLKLMSHNL